MKFNKDEITGLLGGIKLRLELTEQEFKMLNQAVKNNFLAQDAPFIGLLLTRTIGNAEDYRIYATGAAARSNSGTPTLVGQAVR